MQALCRGKPLTNEAGHDVGDAHGAVFLLVGNIETYTRPSASWPQAKAQNLRIGLRRHIGVAFFLKVPAWKLFVVSAQCGGGLLVFNSVHARQLRWVFGSWPETVAMYEFPLGVSSP